MEAEDVFQSLRKHSILDSALVLLDGLDEVPQERRELVRDIVTDFITRSPHNRYLVTSPCPESRQTRLPSG